MTRISVTEDGEPFREKFQEMNAEIDRIKKVYRLRKEKRIYWSLFRPEVHFLDFELQRKYMQAFKLCGVTQENVSTKKLLDAGCGSGKWLRWFQDLGFRQLFGVDILDQEINESRQLNPGINFHNASISALPFEDNYFDFIILSEVFSSILDKRLIEDSARELFRIIAYGGGIFFNDNTNTRIEKTKIDGEHYLRCIKKEDLVKLFPDAQINFSFFLVNPFFTGVLTSIINRGLFRSILRKTPFRNKMIDHQKVLMLKFPYCLVEIAKHFNFLNIHIFAIIRKIK